MPWNQPGGGQQQPPDLDEIFRKLIAAVNRMLGGGGRGGDGAGKADAGGGPGGSGGSGRSGGFGFGFSSVGLFSVALVIWGLSGIYIVSEGSRGVVLRFGEYQVVTKPGPHWHIPYPIETVEKVDIDNIRSAQNKAQMLTKDENIVEVEIATQYRINNVADFLFNVRLPDTADTSISQAEGTLFQVMESALRESVGKSEMDYILGEGRADVAAAMRSLMQTTLDAYEAGIEVISVNLQQSQPPQAVQDAFADAIKAREDEIRFVNEAEAYANGVLPQARGQAARMIEEATAYREKVISNSKGEAARFLDVYEEYRKSPEVTRERLYLQAVESVLSKSSKVMMDIDSGNSLFYLPLDKILEGGGRSRMPEGDERSNAAEQAPPLRDRIRDGAARLRQGRN